MAMDCADSSIESVPVAHFGADGPMLEGGLSVKLPGFLLDRPALEAENTLETTAITVLGAFEDAGLILTSELEHGFEDLPLLATLAGLLRDQAFTWHASRGVATDFRALQKGFVHAFRCGIDLATQLHRRDGDGLRLEGISTEIFDGAHRAKVGPPLTEFAVIAGKTAEDVFVTFQNQSLAIAASTKNEILLGDFYACGCLWAALAGVEAGLTELEPTLAA